jgi:hypothetical protein
LQHNRESVLITTTSHFGWNQHPAGKVIQSSDAGSIIVAGLGATSPIHQQEVVQFLILPWLKVALQRHAALPSGEDGRGRVSRIVALARASGCAATATRGRLFQFWEREGEALGVPGNTKMEAVSFSLPRCGTRTAPLQRRRTPCARTCGPAGSDKERGKCASGSVR